MILPKPEEINNSSKRTIKYLNNHFPGFIEFLNIKYPFAETIREKIYNYLNRPDATSRPLCKICGKPVNYFPTCGYTIYCGRKCSATDLEKKDKKTQTMMQKYGVDHPFKIPEIKQRVKDLWANKTDDELNKIKEKQQLTTLHRYGVVGYTNSEKRKQTNLEKYGVENPFAASEIKEKIKQTNLKKYGVKNPSQSEEIKKSIEETKLKLYGNPYYTNKEKFHQTMLERYGVYETFLSEEIRQKAIETNLERYGVPYTGLSPEIHQKAKQTMFERYGVEYFFQSKESRERYLKKYGVENPSQSEEVKQKIMNTCVKRYGVPFYCMTPECRMSNGNDSKPNRDFSNLLTSNNIIYSREHPIDHYLYDFKVGNTLIEINPTPTHNSTWGLFNKPKETDYHLNKTETANESGFNCIHVWDWDDPLKVVQLITPNETIYARKCFIKEIPAKEANEFLNQYHLQGRCNGQKVCISLIYNNECVGLMTFGKPRYNKKFQWELLRLCFSKNIIGGSERLFKYFVSHYNPESIISYCDKSKFSGTVYKRLGFTLKSTSGPSKHWYNIKTKQHITDNLLRQRGYDQLFNTSYGKGTSNEQLILEHGFVEVYDCGQMTFVWK